MQKHILITLELQTITCPGVSLCPHGPVEVTVNCLGYNHMTRKIQPRFPMSLQETFKMESTFYANTIDELDKKIANEPIEICLWQSGQRLAFYKGTLPSLLARHNSAMVQLLMACSHSLRGAIAPRVQLAAKIEKVENCCTCQSTVLSPMVLIAETVAETLEHFHRLTPRKLRQSPVCHALERPKSKRNSDNAGLFARESPRDPTYRGNVYCHNCLDTLTPTRIRGTDKWELRSNENKQPSCSHPLNSSKSNSESNNASTSSVLAIHPPSCLVCAKYRETFNL